MNNTQQFAFKMTSSEVLAGVSFSQQNIYSNMHPFEKVTVHVSD